MTSKEIEVVKAFIRAINDGNITELSKLMTKDHTFVDSGGRKERGRAKMTSGWKDYFRMFPDFRIETDEFFQSGNRIAFFGSTSATYNGKRGLVPENRVGGPAAWRATVENGQIKTWQVYADWTEDTKTIEADKNI